MADVEIKYKGKVIVGLDGTGNKTLETAETYCESDIEVSYAPRSRIYDITIDPGIYGQDIYLVALDDEVLAHIDDDSFVASLVKLDGENTPHNRYFDFEKYASIVVATNKRQFANSKDGDIYGVELSYVNSDEYRANSVIAPAKQYGWILGHYSSAYFYRNEEEELGGIWCVLCPNDSAFYGTYRLTFTW